MLFPVQLDAPGSGERLLCEEAGEDGFQMFAGAVEASFNGFGRAIQDCADFGVGEVFVFGKDKRGTEFFGEIGHGSADRGGGFGVLQGFAGIGLVQGDRFAEICAGLRVLGVQREFRMS